MRMWDEPLLILDDPLDIHLSFAEDVATTDVVDKVCQLLTEYSGHVYRIQCLCDSCRINPWKISSDGVDEFLPFACCCRGSVEAANKTYENCSSGKTAVA